VTNRYEAGVRVLGANIAGFVRVAEASGAGEQG